MEGRSVGFAYAINYKPRITRFVIYLSASGDKDGCGVEPSCNQPVTFNQVVVDECEDYGKRIRGWRLQTGTNKTKIIAQSEGTVGRNFIIDLDAPVTTSRLRLMIEKATVVPTIWELKTYNQPQ